MSSKGIKKATLLSRWELLTKNKERKTNIKKLVVEFMTVFAIVLVTTAIVTFLWNIIGHGASAVDWETSFRLAIIFGFILTWVKSREIKEK